MLWQILSCPQCGGPLPKQARWRTISCPYCKATVGFGPEPVRAATFREAWERARALALVQPQRLDRRKECYRLLAELGGGDEVDIYLAERTMPTPAVVRLELAQGENGKARLQREAEVLRALHQSEAAGVDVLTRRLPLVLALGTSEGPVGKGRAVLVLRHPPGAWGSLAQVQALQTTGVAPAHVVWIWRRMLESLAFVHASGWVHGDLSLENLLVHPEDHLVHLIGWSRARPLEPSRSGVSLAAPTPQRDLVQTGWAMRALIAGPTSSAPALDKAPKALAALLARVTEDADFSRQTDARTLSNLVSAAAREDFGPPRFLHFILPH